MMCEHPRERELKTERLLLRGAKPADATALHECFSDHELMKYWSTLPHTTMEETDHWIDSMISNPRNGVVDFLIVDIETNLVIGKIGMWSGNEIGFMIARSHWRKGLVSEALVVILPRLFEEPGIESIVADVDPRNEASISVLKKFGFRETGRRERTFEIGGVWVDSLDFALSKEDWRKSTNMQ
jgi:RimJ/RimL family protein N-acetyltransferase